MNTTFRRKHFDVLKSRLAEPRLRIQVVAGPRQVGKSTMVKQVIQDTSVPSLFFTAEDAPNRDAQWITSCWEQARQTLIFNQYEEVILVIDEIHKLNNWSEVVKAEWDRDTFHDVPIKVVILGSSRLLLMDGLRESLAGRFEMIEMGHWSYSEMHEAFGLTINQYIYFGGYPGSAAYIHNEQRWCSYVKDTIIEPAITKDVLMTKRIYKPALMRQLFEIGCNYSGELLAYNKILGQLQDAGNTDTLVNYMQVLQESCLLAGLQKYASDASRKYRSIPKLLTFNSALLSAESNRTFEQVFTNPTLWGRWVESAVGSHIMNQAKQNFCKMYYWRHDDDEVDFVLEKGENSIAIEVKSGRRQNNKGIYIFNQQFHPTASVVVGGPGISVEQFLSMDLAYFLSQILNHDKQ